MTFYSSVAQDYLYIYIPIYWSLFLYKVHIVTKQLEVAYNTGYKWARQHTSEKYKKDMMTEKAFKDMK